LREIAWSLTFEIEWLRWGEILQLRGPGPVQSALDDLWRSLVSFKSDSEVLGILLGLEIPAEENIEMIFTSLGYSESVSAVLAKTKFFALHRAIEIEHVRLTVSNFLRFCSTEEQRAQFVAGFDTGLEFWKRYWNAVSDGIAEEMGVGVAHA
jgi:pyrroloquinoline quinone (PQQ) biosynthesis protein C